MSLCSMCWAEHDEDGPCAPAPLLEKAKRISRLFDAKYSSFCVVCEKGIAEGDSVCFIEDDELAHETCTERK